MPVLKITDLQQTTPDLSGQIIFWNASNKTRKCTLSQLKDLIGGGGGDTSTLVPYNGATQNVNIGEYQLKSGQIEFDQTPTQSAGVAKMRWNDEDGTVDLGLKGGNVTLQIGQETVVYVKNVDNTTINDGDVVYIFGASGNRPSVKKASNTSSATSNKTIGIATESISVNGFGFITTQGLVHGLNTNAFDNGDILWLGSTAGSVTKTEPVAPAQNVFIGVVTKKSGGDGHIFVYPKTGFNLEQLNDVSAASKSNYVTLVWDNINNLWVADYVRNRYEEVDISAEDFEISKQGTYSIITKSGFDINFSTPTSGDIGKVITIVNYNGDKGIVNIGLNQPMMYFQSIDSEEFVTQLKYSQSITVQCISRNNSEYIWSVTSSNFTL